MIARREEYARAEAAKAEAEPEAAAADFSSKLVETGLSSNGIIDFQRQELRRRNDAGHAIGSATCPSTPER